MGSDRLLQIFRFIAGQQADRSQRREVPFCRLDITHHQVGLADVLVRAAVLRVDRQRASVVLERFVELAEAPVSKAQFVVQVGCVGEEVNLASAAPQPMWNFDAAAAGGARVRLRRRRLYPWR
jgi:hypothetical protein